MRVTFLTWVIASFRLLCGVQSYLTTISVEMSYCPAPDSTLATGTSASKPTTEASVPYVLYITRSAAGTPEYVTDTGAITPDVSQAQPFTLSPSGQLMSGHRFFSTSGLEPYEVFTPRSYSAMISTTFSFGMNANKRTTGDIILTWKNAAFALNEAFFCVRDTTIEVVYDGDLPNGCDQVAVHGTPASAFITTVSIPSSSTAAATITTPTPSAPGSVHGDTAVGDSIGCLNSPSTTPALSGINSTTPTLEACVDFCAAYSYFGVQYGNLCVCANTLGTSASPASFGSCNSPCTGNSSEKCGGSTAMAVYSIFGRGSSAGSSSSSTSTNSLYPSPTTTGTPNCFDRSVFDGTVNNGYLVLCNTDLVGDNLQSMDGTDIADCISKCNSYPPSSQGECIAVEYDITALSRQCQLKYNISVINRGDNQFAQAAILVNKAYSPSIIFADQMNTPTLSTAGSSSGSSATKATVASTTQAIFTSTTATTPLQSPPQSSTTSLLRSTTSVPKSTPSVVATSSAIGFSSSTPVLSSVVASSSVILVTSSAPLPNLSTVASSTRIPSTTSSATGCAVTPTGVLCPSYSGSIVNSGESCYDIECSAMLIGTILTGNESMANSLNVCNDFCNVYNLALPFGCHGVNYLEAGGANNCLLLSDITGLTYNPGTDSGSLIFEGYVSRAISGAPTSTLPSSSVRSSSIMLSSSPFASLSSSVISTQTSTLAASSSTSPSLSSTSIPNTTTTSSAILSSSASSTRSSSSSSFSTPCATSYAAGPTQGSLCPTNNGRVLSYTTYSKTENYEVECGTVFTGSLIGGTVAFDLPSCIQGCQYNNNLGQGCVAVSFNNTPSNFPPINNCNTYSKLTSLTRGNSVFDSARMLTNIYPCPVDMNSGYVFNATAGA